jgi:Short C-terminal domain
MKNVKLFGKYLGGHPQSPKARSSARLVCDEDGLSIQGTVSSKKVVALPWSEITEIAVDGNDTIEARVTATRFVTLGIFALAAPKKKGNKAAYVTCRAQSGDLVFEVPGAEPHKLSARLAEPIALVSQRPPEPSDDSGTLVAQLNDLAALRESGALSLEEYAAAKAKLLG